MMPPNDGTAERLTDRPGWSSADEPRNLPPVRRKTALDKDLKRIGRIERAAAIGGRRSTRIGFGLVFLGAVWAYAAFQAGGLDNNALVIAACVVGGYMALNIGANDVANNVSPAVGAQALTLTGALVIAAIFEAAGALLAGGDVVATISKGIIDGDRLGSPELLIWSMLAALLAAALWVNLATYLSAPVSTTHAIVGAVAGAGIAAVGPDAVNWPVMGQIAASWVVSPLLGALIAAAFLAFIKFAILYRDDRVDAAKRWVPVLVAIMSASFSVYLIAKGLNHIWRPGAITLAVIGVGIFLLTLAVVRPMVARAAVGLDNRRKSVVRLFTVPLICAAALLSFAHGANDVANAVGPLAAIVSAAQTGTVAAEVGIPFWVMLVGGLGISVGLALFGPALIRTVGEEITKLDRARAFAIALSAAITVILASALGLPVSSTHIAIGALFGVGFLREWLDRRRRLSRAEIMAKTEPWRSLPDAAEGLDHSELAQALWREKARKAQKRKLVRRRQLLTIVAAWVITVPLTAMLSAGLFILLRAFLHA